MIRRVKRMPKHPQGPREKIQCELSTDELHPTTIGWAGYREKRVRQNGQDPTKCMRYASWEVDGKRLCTQHAGMAALEILEHGDG